MENLAIIVIVIAVISFAVITYLAIQLINKLDYRSDLGFLEGTVEICRKDSDNRWDGVLEEFRRFHKRIEKLEKETKVSTVDRKDIFSNEYCERANRQALDIAKYTEFLARENSKEMIDRLEAIPYLFRTDTEDNLIKNYHYFNQKK